MFKQEKSKTEVSAFDTGRWFKIMPSQ